MPARRFPRSTEVQTVIFDKDVFSRADAKEWAHDHGFLAGKIDEKENTFRMRQQDPSAFTHGTFRTISLTEGVKAVVGMPRAHRNPPLAEHMSHDDLREIAEDLAQRLYDDPSEGAEFVRDCLRAVTSGLGDRAAEGEYAQKREIRQHLHEAWKHLNGALALMHPRR